MNTLNTVLSGDRPQGRLCCNELRRIDPASHPGPPSTVQAGFLASCQVKRQPRELLSDKGQRDISERRVGTAGLDSQIAVDREFFVSNARSYVVFFFES